jgi:hypothetical protein
LQFICGEQWNDDVYRELDDGRVLGTEQCFGYRLPFWLYVAIVVAVLVIKKRYRGKICPFHNKENHRL